ncbi:MAG TPA: M1 family aminopeptidase [Polyangiaceae bacterium]
MARGRRLFPILFAIACGGGHHVARRAQPSVPIAIDMRNPDDHALLVALAARDKDDDAHFSDWYDPQLLTSDVRPDVLAGLLRAAGPLDQLTLYDFDLSIGDDTRTFLVDERVYFQNRSSAVLHDLVFRIYANTPPGRDPPETFMRGHCVQTACTVQAEGRDVVVVHPAEPIAPGGRLRVVLHVSGLLPVLDPRQLTIAGASDGAMQSLLGHSSGAPGDYGLLGSGDGILSFANFYPVVARHDGEAWDLDRSTLGDIGPDSLSHVRAHVELPAGYVVAASGMRSNEAQEEARQRVDFSAGCMRDFALLASSQFTTMERRQGDVRVRSFFRATEREMGEKVLDAAAWALADFEKRFGAYPYRELDLVEQALAGGVGGVEFAGLGTVASMYYKPTVRSSDRSLDTLLLGGGNADPALKDIAAEFTTAHEVAHQWFHGIVGSDSRKHPWQDEALAQFCAMIYCEDRYGAARAKRDGDLNARLSYQMMRVLGSPDGPVDAAAGTQTQLVYGGLVYGKGPYYLDALRHRLGDASFFAAMKDYVARHYLSFAEDHAFEQAMAHATGSSPPDIATLSHRWLHETHGDDDLGMPDRKTLMKMLGP